MQTELFPEPEETTEPEVVTKVETMAKQKGYQPKHEALETVIIEGAYVTILEVDGDRYRLSINGRLKWRDAREVDAISDKI